jgi:hypothetical protein
MNNTLKLKKTDGTTLHVPLDRLSDEDRKYIKEIQVRR